MDRMLLLRFLWLVNSFAAHSPPALDRVPFFSQGHFHGGDTRNLNLERINFVKTRNLSERLDIFFSAGSRKYPSRRVPPYQIRFEPRNELREFDRLVVVFQAVSSRNISRLSLARAVKDSRLIQFIRVHPPLEDGDTAMELALKGSSEFRADVDIRGSLGITLRPAVTPPNLAN